MSKRTLYDSIIKEVTADVPLIKPLQPQTYEEAIHNDGNTVMLPKNIGSLTAPVSAFADFDVRDGLILKALQDESFAFVLIAKVAGAVYKHEENITQDDIEALAVVANVSAMWEQTHNARLTLKVIRECIKSIETLVEPTLVALTERILDTNGFPFEMIRKGSDEPLAKIEARLNTNSDRGE
jgi:hypothetical protein